MGHGEGALTQSVVDTERSIDRNGLWGFNQRSTEINCHFKGIEYKSVGAVSN